METYLLARLVCASPVAGGAPHSLGAEGDVASFSCWTVAAPLPVVAGTLEAPLPVVAGAVVVVAADDRQRGGSGCQRPPAPQVTCWAPSSWKPGLQVKLSDSPTL